MYTQNHNKKLFLSHHIIRKVRSQKSIVSKRNFKKFVPTLLPIVKKVVSHQINKINSIYMHKIRSNKRQNTLKSASNREIKSLKDNPRVKATREIINTPKIVNEKPLNQKKLSNQKRLTNQEF